MAKREKGGGAAPSPSGAERELRLVVALIANDAYAMTFQTLGQYRRALLKSIVTMVEVAA
jgi:transcriptional regulator CtsR